jgi:large subunit ribosomal protein L15
VKLHDLHPAPGARRARTRVGRGIAAGQGKTAGRGTKGQKSRTGASIPAWFEGGQTPIHVRVPKLHGFRNRSKVVYQVVNVGQISDYAAAGRFGVEPTGKAAGGKKAAAGKQSAEQPLTVNAEVLASAGLVRSADKPLKILGEGEVGQKLFVAADAFSAAARSKIEAAGGFVQVMAPEKEATAAKPAEALQPAEKEQPAEETSKAAETPAEEQPAKTARAKVRAAKPAAPKPPAAKPEAEEAPAPKPAARKRAPKQAPAAQTASGEAVADSAAETPAPPAEQADKPARRRAAKKPGQA